MQLDVTHFMAFYDQPLGRLIRPVVNAQIRKQWPTLSDRRLLGLGYSIPYMQPYYGTAERVLACMPAAQGVTNWPRDKPNLVSLAVEHELPFEDASIDNVLIVHGIELSRHPDWMLRDVWRILAPAGRLIVITVNRSGLWARTESTPFGYGHPYSRGQLNSLLASCDFQSVSVATALHVPPSNNKIVLRSVRVLENLGRRFWPRLGGLIIVEAQKLSDQGVPVKKAKSINSRIVKPVFATGQTAGSTG